MKISLGRLGLSTLSIILFFAALGIYVQDLDDVTITGRITDSNKLAVAGLRSPLRRPNPVPNAP